MEEKEKDIRRNLAQNLGDLAESVIKRIPPLDRMPLQKEAIPYSYSKYTQYFDEIDLSLGERILAMLVEYAQWSIKERLLPGKDSFNSIYPQHVETKNAFAEWILLKEGPRPPTAPMRVLPAEKMKVSQIIRQIMKERMPEFKYDRSLGNFSITSFSVPILDDNRVYIVADKGTKRRFIDFSFCIHWPRAYFDIATFFASSQSTYRYHSEEDLVTVVNKALDVIEILFPHFADKVKKALTEVCR